MKTYSSLPGEEKHRQIPCNLCGSAENSELFSSTYYRFVRCRNCGLVFQNPQPLSDDLVERYDENYFDYEINNEAQFFHLMELGLKDIDFFGLESSLPEPKRFLDVGCATGMLLESMKKRGWQEHGVEVCRPSAEYGRTHRGVRIHTEPLESIGFNEGFFSAAHASHLIEHLTDPKGFAREIYRVLAPGGLFIVTTPNIAGLQAKIFRSEWRSAIPDHTFLFSVTTLQKLLQDTGFTVEAQATWGGLAVGTAPLWLKKPVDKLAKALGFGDVMIMRGRK